MREILFRGKRKDNGEWFYGDLLHQRYIKMDIRINSPNNGGQRDVIPETVGQYTGLTDKNGTKIFEGDIIKFDDRIWQLFYTSYGTEYNSYITENYGVVGFDENYGRYDFIKYKYSDSSVEEDLHKKHKIDFSYFVRELEVIGNIYDNSELLENEAENENT